MPKTAPQSRPGIPPSPRECYRDFLRSLSPDESIRIIGSHCPGLEKRAGYRQAVANLETEAEGLVILIRNILDPYAEEIGALRIPEATAAMNRLKAIFLEVRWLKEKIEKP